jgi:hypothetical protein
MSLVFRIIIQIYWKILPKEKRRVCLYKVSCSNYIYNILKSKGFVSGLKSMIYRLRNCNNNYEIFNDNGFYYIRTSRGLIIKEDEMSESILNAIK